MARAAVGGEQQGGDVQRLAGAPQVERRRSQDVVDLQRQVHAVLRREESIHREGAQLVEGRGLDLQDELGQVERAILTPGGLEDIGKQDMLT